MRYLVFLLLPGISACMQDAPKTKAAGNPPLLLTNREAAGLENRNGCWTLHGKPYNGYITEQSGGHTTALVPVTGGHENGIAYGWYKSGHKMYERSFADGNRHGLHQGWYENGQTAFVYHFLKDKYEGGQQAWYANGKLRQTLHYRNGQEEGKQKGWNDRGRLVNNYTVKNGKLYGVIGRYDCMPVHGR